MCFGYIIMAGSNVENADRSMRVRSNSCSFSRASDMKIELQGNMMDMSISNQDVEVLCSLSIQN